MGRFLKQIKKAASILLGETKKTESNKESVSCTVDPEKPKAEAKPFRTTPAPAITEPDPWFNEPIKSEKQMDYEEMLEVEREREEAEKPPTKEPEDIHEVMYKKATKNQNTTVQLNPPGGSENFQSGPGGWSSGTGQNQFR